MACVGVSCNFHDWFESLFSHCCDHYAAILYREQKKNIFLIQQTPLSFRKYFFSSFCIWATHLLIQSECSMHMCDREIDIYTHIYLINNLLKVHLHSTALHIFVLIRAVNQHWELFRPDLLSSVSKHKEHWVYHIGLPTSIWTNDTGKALRKR